MALIACLPSLVRAQTQLARLRVDVRADAGAAIPGATVELALQPPNGPPVIATSALDGVATFGALRPGRYVARVHADGFRTAVIRDLDIAEGRAATLPVTLMLGAITEQVVVVASPATLRTTGGTVGASFDGDALRALPSAERDLVTLAQQAAGVSSPAPGSRLSTQGNAALNSSGAREAANNFLVDGLDNNDLFLNRLIVNPSLDAVASMTLRQNTYSAEFGRSAGAQIDMVLKSGTTQLSGSAYEFYRPSPRHLFGGTIGGPLPRASSSFFFISGEGVTARESDARQAHVPTVAERSGDFSASGITIIDPFTGAPFPGNRIPSSRISATSRLVAALYPQPNQTDAATNFGATPDATRAAASFAVKTDHRLRHDDMLSLRYAFSTDRRDFPFVARNRNLPGFGVTTLDRGQSAGASFTQVLSAQLLHTARVGVSFSRRENLPGQRDTDGFAALGMTGPALGALDLGYPAILVSGLESLGDDANLPVVRRTRAMHMTDTLTFERGRHQVKAGAEVRTYASDGDNHLFARGRLSFSGAFTGNGFADLLLGYPSFSLLGSNNNRQTLRTWAVNAFAQDEWRVNARLTANVGVRYEFNAPPTDADNRMKIFDATRLALVDVGTNGVPSAGVAADLDNIAPRLGLSWDVTGRGTTVVRSGYGVFYDSGTLIENSALYFNPPYYQLQLFFPTATSLLRIENPFPAGRGISPLTSVNSVDQHFQSAYAHQVSTSVEHAWLGALTTVRYVGAFGRHLVRKRNLNQPLPGPGAIDARRPLQGFGDILMVESQGRSTYHGLQVSVDRRMQRGLEAHAAYTWSTSQDDASAFLASDGNDNTPQDSRNLAAEWGPSDFDVRHRLVASLTWLSTGAGAGAPSRSWLLRDWQVSALLTAQSGRPFTPRLSTDNSNTGNTGGATFASDRPNILVGPPAPGQVTASYGGYTFVTPERFTFGSAGRNILTGPAYVSLDVLVSRHVRLGTRQSMELRAEAFNVFNRDNGQLPDSYVDHVTFGQSLAQFPARQVQFAVRIAF